MVSDIIDFHTHVHPTAKDGVAFQRLWGDQQPERNGTPEELLPMMDRAGIGKTLIVPWMPAQDHADRLAIELSGVDPADGEHHAEAAARIVESWVVLNQWAVDTVAAFPDRFLCLVGLDPILMSEELVRREAADKLSKGAVGLKIAPMFLRTQPDDERMAIVFELAREHGVWVLSQAGGAGYDGAPAWGHPRHFEAVLQAYPEVDIMLAHLGIGAEEEVARLTAAHANLYADCSSRLHLLGKPGEWSLAEAAEWFRRIGMDRVVFGTNYPICDPVVYTQVIDAMPLTEAERRQVCFENALGILRRAGQAT